MILKKYHFPSIISKTPTETIISTKEIITDREDKVMTGKISLIKEETTEIEEDNSMLISMIQVLLINKEVILGTLLIIMTCD